MTCARRCSRNSDVFVVSFTEKLMTYALGRPVTHSDAPTVRDIVRKQPGGSVPAGPRLIMNIIDSAPFQQRARTHSATARQHDRPRELP